ncbi:unnamed protein product [Vitrella brassicaformis CCMP3155]|uniref:Methyltransferase domain-containing protein n=2 Tax=Vitrella brassicaformis TaxID=1169539 RepID=A0A0G4GF91_VITBC|nr:unnamed protein product [Vitrella brassicaformis CCMP3155]|eukprot:CEM27817.1 unnamed protein product [Vitrella brassicaformis CCMP3155]
MMPSAQDGAFWESNWQEGVAPGDEWDTSKPTPVLVKYVADGVIPKGKALVPGCGRGYDVGALSDLSREVIGLDISETGANVARDYLKGLDLPGKWSIETADFFTYDRPSSFDFIFDYTFLCAIQPDMRAAWAKQMHSLLKDNGLLMVAIFPICDKEGGPPFALSLEGVRRV